jgi:hypothetical protein
MTEAGTMKRIALTLAFGVAALGVLPGQARAQLVRPIVPIASPVRIAQQQVISWYQAYLGRLPNAQELNILSNMLLTGNNSLYVQSVILSSNEFYIRSGSNPLRFINALFLVTLGRQVTPQERSVLLPQLNVNGRLWFTQAFLAQVQGGWRANPVLAAAAWGYPTPFMPVIWW